MPYPVTPALPPSRRATGRSPLRDQIRKSGHVVRRHSRGAPPRQADLSTSIGRCPPASALPTAGQGLDRRSLSTDSTTSYRHRPRLFALQLPTMCQRTRPGAAARRTPPPAPASWWRLSANSVNPGRTARPHRSPERLGDRERSILRLDQPRGGPAIRPDLPQRISSDAVLRSPSPSGSTQITLAKRPVRPRPPIAEQLRGLDGAAGSTPIRAMPAAASCSQPARGPTVVPFLVLQALRAGAAPHRLHVRRLVASPAGAD